MFLAFPNCSISALPKSHASNSDKTKSNSSSDIFGSSQARICSTSFSKSIQSQLQLSVHSARSLAFFHSANHHAIKIIRDV